MTHMTNTSNTNKTKKTVTAVLVIELAVAIIFAIISFATCFTKSVAISFPMMTATFVILISAFASLRTKEATPEEA